MGLIYWWARIASFAPGFVNYFTRTQPFAGIVKFLGGISQRRELPPFASPTFKHWFLARGVRNIGKPPVILWPDTFNNHFFPGTAKAAVEVLETAGFQVLVPRIQLCCGRPLYDYGFLRLAKGLLRQVLETLQSEIRSGTPIVGLEPSCVAVFREELTNLFPNEEDAIRLSKQTYLLSEFLEQQAPEFKIPKLYRQAVVHAHCHHAAVMKLGAEEKILKALGVNYEVLNSGCCGMAGSFGFEAGKFDVSTACGERVLLPAIRHAAKDTLIVADGFSCREQIQQRTDRHALHLAEVIQIAMTSGPRGSEGNFPERDHVPAVKTISALQAYGFLALCTFSIGVLVSSIFRRCNHEHLR